MKEERKLREKLKFFRIERPSEWMMDEFMRDAERLEQERNELAVHVERLRSTYNSATTWEDLGEVLNETPAHSLEVVEREVRKKTLDDIAYAVRYEFEGPFSSDTFDDFIDNILHNHIECK